MSPRTWDDGEWRKSTRSNGVGNCVEVALWRKSSRSNGAGNCVEVTALDTATIGIRDSKDPAGPVLTVPATAWSAFIAAQKI